MQSTQNKTTLPDDSGNLGKAISTQSRDVVIPNSGTVSAAVTVNENVQQLSDPVSGNFARVTTNNPAPGDAGLVVRDHATRRLLDLMELDFNGRSSCRAPERVDRNRVGVGQRDSQR